MTKARKFQNILCNEEEEERFFLLFFSVCRCQSRRFGVSCAHQKLITLRCKTEIFFCKAVRLQKWNTFTSSQLNYIYRCRVLGMKSRIVIIQTSSSELKFVGEDQKQKTRARIKLERRRRRESWIPCVRFQCGSHDFWKFNYCSRCAQHTKFKLLEEV